jgi:hypothetical protein
VDPRTTNDTCFVATLWSSYGAAARRLPAFPGFARKIGMTGCGINMARRMPVGVSRRGITL